MSSFHLTIVCPDGCIYDGDAEFITIRTNQGEVGILPNHIAYTAALGMGPCKVTIGDTVRLAACIGGMLQVHDNKVNVIATTFEWKEDIDLERAKRSLARSDEHLAMPDLSETDRVIWEAQRRRAVVRIGVAES